MVCLYNSSLPLLTTAGFRLPLEGLLMLGLQALTAIPIVDTIGPLGRNYFFHL